VDERRTPLWRRLLSWIFLILFCVAAPTALVAGWARQTLIDEDTYTQSVARAADDPRVQMGVSRVVVTRAEAMLSGDNPSATGSAAITRRSRGVWRSNTWGGRQRRVPRNVGDDQPEAHRLLFSGPAAGQGQPVSLDFAPLLDEIQAQVAALDVDVPPDLNLDAAALRIDVLDGATADSVRRAVVRLDLAFWLALAVTVLSLLLSIALAPDRLAALGRAGFGLGIAMIVLMALMVVSQAWLTGAASDGGGVAIGAILDAISQGLRLSAVGLALVGLIVAGVFAGLRMLRGSTTRRRAARGRPGLDDDAGA
jgi:hypothetical protein